ncbi:MAG TPA: apolipoprotein N-acyltransferase, partial [Polyangiaceae bacterium]|nr:apolipoprotein N-acyltransferase [Polyangiaceae bacterium]
MTPLVPRRPLAPNPPPLGSRAAAGLAVACGFLYFLAFPGPDVWPLSFVALAPLMVALHGQTAKRAAWLGWLAGFTMTMVGFYWLLELLQEFSGFGTPLCLLFTAILCGYQSGRIALFGWLHARISQRGYPGGLAFALGFAASEQAFPLLFPWSYAATVHQVPALTQLAELGGPILVALPLVAANVAVAEAALAWRAKRPLNWRRLAWLCAVPVLSALYGAVRIPAVDARSAAAPKGKIGLVQANMSLQGKRANKEEGMRRHMELSHELTRQNKLDLLIWSETSVMSALLEDDIDPNVPMEFAASLRVPTLFGAVIIKPVEDARRYILYNSALLSDRRGRVVGRFDKQRLVMFSESMPFGEAFPVLYEWSPNSGKFVPGTRYDPLTFGKHQVATIICYEDIIPSFVNRIVNNGDPDLIANLTNDAWFGDTTEPWIHLALATLRAVEHRRYFVRSTNSGVSAIVDPVGRVVDHGGTFKEEALVGEIAWLHGSTVYEVLGDVPWWIVSVVALGLAFSRPRRRPKGPADPVRSEADTEPALLSDEAAGAGPKAVPGTADLDVEFRRKARRWLGR